MNRKGAKKTQFYIKNYRKLSKVEIREGGLPQTQLIKEAMDLKESWEEYMSGFEGRKRKKEMQLYHNLKNKCSPNIGHRRHYKSGVGY